MPDPIVIPREKHPISRRDIDPDALRVLYRLQQADHIAYLVGGSVRDLILGRRPKDFDIGTDAHPHQIKRLFRNCWIIGRRFRLAHIKFGQKTIEVATFRKNVADVPPDAPAPTIAGDDDSMLVATAAPTGVEADQAILEMTEAADEAAAQSSLPPSEALAYHSRGDGPAGRRGDRRDDKHGIVHRDNTFGTTEEDAFRRDFTVNALFYDVATFSVIDYVGGLEDLEKRVIRSIGDPLVRFVEDPVRMLRAAVLSARLEFHLDSLVSDAINEIGHLITRASPARLLEEYFKILRSGSAEASFRALQRVGLLELMTPELKSPPKALWDSLARLDRYRQRFPSAPPDLTTPILIGALLHPIGALNRRMPERGAADDGFQDRVSFGALPVARKDLDRLRQLMQTLPRLSDLSLPPRVARGLPHRPSFADALTWLEVFGDEPDMVESWKAIKAALPPRPAHPAAHGHRRHGHGQAHPPASPREPGQAPEPGNEAIPAGDGLRRKRRRRRRRGRRGGGGAAAA